MLHLLLIVAIMTYVIYIWAFVEEDRVKTIIILSLALVLVGGSYVMADYLSYETYYSMMSTVESINSLDVMSVTGYTSGDLGYLILNLIFYKTGFDFSEYRFICFSMFLFAIIWQSRKCVQCVWFVLLLYLIYPLFMDGIQFRNTFVEIALLVAICQLIEWNWKNVFLYIFCLLIAATFHKIALIYILFPVWIVARKYCAGRLISYIFMFLGVCTPLLADVILSKIDVIYMVLLEVGQYTSYVTDDFGIRRYIAYVCVLGAALFTTYVEKKIGNKEHRNEQEIKYIKLISEFSKYLLAMAPIFILSRELSRVPRNMLLLIYMVIGIYIQSIDYRLKKYMIYFVVILLIGIYGYIDFYMYEGHDIMWSAYNYNYLLDVLK